MNTEQQNKYIKDNWSKMTVVDIARNLGKNERTIRRRADALNLPKKSSLDTFSEDLGKAGFDPENWSFGWLKSETSSIFIKNEKGFMTYMDIRDELITEMKKYAPRYPKLKRSKGQEYLLVIDPTDSHFGKLALKPEADDYNLEIAEKRFNDGIDELIAKVSGFQVTKIVMVLGNDILHIDNPKRTTTSGTPQDTDGMWWKAYEVAKRCYIKSIEKLLTIADVHLIHCPSNHDFMSGFMLSDSVASWFAHNKNVTSTINQAHRKYIVYGLNLIGFTHGDGAKKTDLGALMAREAKEAWSKCVFTYWYVHHLHHKEKLSLKTGDKRFDLVEKDLIDVTIIHSTPINPEKNMQVEVIRTITGADRWHNTNGYVNMQAMECFLHSPNGGQIARFTHYY